MATSYRLDGPGTESRWEARFSPPVQADPVATQPPIQSVPGLFPGGKGAGDWR
jgi:hypothetical protein